MGVGGAVQNMFSMNSERLCATGIFADILGPECFGGKDVSINCHGKKLCMQLVVVLDARIPALNCPLLLPHEAQFCL